MAQATLHQAVQPALGCAGRQGGLAAPRGRQGYALRHHMAPCQARLRRVERTGGLRQQLVEGAHLVGREPMMQARVQAQRGAGSVVQGHEQGGKRAAATQDPQQGAQDVVTLMPLRHLPAGAAEHVVQRGQALDAFGGLQALEHFVELRCDAGDELALFAQEGGLRAVEFVRVPGVDVTDQHAVALDAGLQVATWQGAGQAGADMAPAAVDAGLNLLGQHETGGQQRHQLFQLGGHVQVGAFEQVGDPVQAAQLLDALVEVMEQAFALSAQALALGDIAQHQHPGGMWSVAVQRGGVALHGPLAGQIEGDQEAGAGLLQALAHRADLSGGLGGVQQDANRLSDQGCR